jgi:NitT/TauT family transport system substrate-binding protein
MTTKDVAETGMHRRQFLHGAAAALGLGAAAAPAVAQSRTKLRVGYLHTLAVDGQLWLADHLGAWAKHGLEPEFRQFTTGLELFQAMIGGSIDMLTTGAVISNFPARGQGKMFLVNCVEFATAQLWVREDQGVKGFADLKQKRIATTTGTTAHVFLDIALRANGVDPAKDVEIVNQRMSEAVTSFISGAVPAVALWVPFNVTVRDKVPGARKLVDASAYYPQAAIVSGWAARNDYHEKQREVLARVVRAWKEGNDFLVGRSAEALDVLQKKHYAQVPLADLKEQFGAQRVFPTAEWRKLYADGTVTKWLQQVTDFFVKFGNIQNPVPAAQYFDPKIYLET